jgi:HSP20 family protein
MFVVPLSHARRASVQHRAFDRLFDESIDRLFGGSSTGTRTPAMDVVETDAAYNVVLDVPGVAKDQLKVSVEGRRVSIETIEAAAADTKTTGERTLYRERNAPRYARTVSLPAEVDQTASQARFENGVLTLTLAKKVPTGATQLTIS